MPSNFRAQELHNGFFLALVAGALAFAQIPGPARAAPGDIEWIRQFGSPNLDRGTAAAIGSDGVYVAGFAQGALPGQAAVGGGDAYLRKYDASGNALWTRQFGTLRVDFASDVSVDGSSVYVGGTNGTDIINSQAFLRKYDASGNLLWTREFGSSSNDGLNGIAADGAGGIYVVGSTRGTLPGQVSAGAADAFVRKYDASGNVLWTRQFGTPADEVLGGIAVDASGVYVAGSTSGALPGQIHAGTRDTYLRKYDASGNVLWTRQFGTPVADDPSGVAVDATGVYVAGSTDGALPGQAGSDGRDAFVRRYDPDGNVLWTDQFGTSNRDVASDVVSNGTCGVYLVGSTQGVLPDQASAGGDDAFVRKYDASGNVIWTRQFGTPVGDHLSGGACSPDELYVVGDTEGVLPSQATAGGIDAFIAMLESDGITPPSGPPAAPMGLTGMLGNESAILYWDEPSDAVDGWEVSFKEPGDADFAPLVDGTTDSGFTEKPIFSTHAQSTPQLVLMDGETNFLVKAVRGVKSAASETYSFFKAVLLTDRPDFPVLFLHGIPGRADPNDPLDNTWNEVLFCNVGWRFGGFLTIDPSSPETDPVAQYHPTNGRPPCIPSISPQNGDFFIAGFRKNFGAEGPSQGDYANGHGLYNWALEVEAFLKTLKAQTGEDKFIVVAHSAGGIGARLYVQPPGVDTPSENEILRPEYNSDVAHLITFGTPHSGAEIDNILDRINELLNDPAFQFALGTNVLLSSVFSGVFDSMDFGTVGVNQLQKGSPLLGDLNSREPRANVALTSILGGSIYCSGFPVSFRGEPLFPFLDDHDCLVEVESQKFDDARPYPPDGRCGGFVNAIHNFEPENVHTVLVAVGARKATFCGASPIDLEITDPDGLMIGRTFTEIPGALYRELRDQAGATPRDLVGIPFAKDGEYEVLVIPDPDAQPTDTFSLEVTLNGVTTVLA